MTRFVEDTGLHFPGYDVAIDGATPNLEPGWAYGQVETSEIGVETNVRQSAMGIFDSVAQLEKFRHDDGSLDERNTGVQALSNRLYASKQQHMQSLSAVVGFDNERASEAAEELQGLAEQAVQAEQECHKKIQALDVRISELEASKVVTRSETETKKTNIVRLASESTEAARLELLPIPAMQAAIIERADKASKALIAEAEVLGEQIKRVAAEESGTLLEEPTQAIEFIQDKLESGTNSDLRAIHAADLIEVTKILRKAQEEAKRINDAAAEKAFQNNSAAASTAQKLRDAAHNESCRLDATSQGKYKVSVTGIESESRMLCRNADREAQEELDAVDREIRGLRAMMPVVTPAKQLFIDALEAAAIAAENAREELIRGNNVLGIELRRTAERVYPVAETIFDDDPQTLMFPAIKLRPVPQPDLEQKDSQDFEYVDYDAKPEPDGEPANETNEDSSTGTRKRPTRPAVQRSVRNRVREGVREHPVRSAIGTLAAVAVAATILVSTSGGSSVEANAPANKGPVAEQKWVPPSIVAWDKELSAVAADPTIAVKNAKGQDINIVKQGKYHGQELLKSLMMFTSGGNDLYPLIAVDPVTSKRLSDEMGVPYDEKKVTPAQSLDIAAKLMNDIAVRMFDNPANAGKYDPAKPGYLDLFRQDFMSIWGGGFDPATVAAIIGLANEWHQPNSPTFKALVSDPRGGPAWTKVFADAEAQLKSEGK